MTKKGGAGVVWAIVGGIIFIALIITLLIIVSQKGFLSKTNTPSQNSSMDLYLMGKDSLSSESTNGNYILAYSSNGTFQKFNEGKLEKDSWTEIKGVLDQPIYIYSFNDGYYTTKTKKTFTLLERQNNVSKTEVPFYKIGNLEVKSEGNLNNENNKISVNITARDGWVNRVGMAVKWTAGIVTVKMESNRVTCNSGEWKNYTNYNYDTQVYEWLPQDNYICGDRDIEECLSTNGVLCELKTPKIPVRLSNKVDDIFYVGKSLASNESYQFTIDVKTIKYKNELDYIELIFFDYDSRFDQFQGLNWINEEGGSDVGSNDKVFRLYYKQ